MELAGAGGVVVEVIDDEADAIDREGDVQLGEERLWMSEPACPS